MPSPNAGSTRPPDSTSSVAHDFASNAGLRPGSTCTLVPSLSRALRPAATARPITGSGDGAPTRSESQSESNRCVIERVDERGEPVGVARRGVGAQPETDPNLHQP